MAEGGVGDGGGGPTEDTKPVKALKHVAVGPVQFSPGHPTEDTKPVKALKLA